MPGCNQALTAISKDCSPNIGGIKKLLLNLASAIDSVTVDGTSGKINAITLVTAPESDGQGGTVQVPVSKFKEFALPKGACSLASALTGDAANGKPYSQNTLALLFNRMDTEKRVAVSALAISDCVAIVIDNNNKAWYVGKDDALVANGGDSGTGAAKSDRNGYGINMVNEEPEYPYEVDQTSVNLDNITD